MTMMLMMRLWLLASLGLACVSSVADGALRVMSAPSRLRVGTAESVFVECQDCAGLEPMIVHILVWNHPSRTRILQHTSVTLSSFNRYQAFGELVIPRHSFYENPTAKQYVFLQAAFPGYILEKAVLVSFRSAYLFIQTDRTMYTPDSVVNFRIFGLTPGMQPVETDERREFLAYVTVEIVTPEGVVIPLGPASLRAGMYSGSYKLGDIGSAGRWKVVSRFQGNPHQAYWAEFEVKNYVLPSFEVKLTSQSPFYYYDAQTFTVRVKAAHLFGKGVDGVAYVVFGAMGNSNRKVFPSSLQRIPVTHGNGEATLQKDHVLNAVPNLEELVGSSLFVTAVVYTESGSEMVEGELRNTAIVTSPYVISFDKTPKYFKAGMLFDVTVTVTDPNGSPAEGVPVVVEPGQNHGITRANGRARLTVGTRPTDTALTVTARTNDSKLPSDKQTATAMVARPYETKSKKYIHIHVMTTDVKLGTNLKVQLHLSSRSRRAEMTYLILSRGQLVHFGRHVSEGHVTPALVIPVTQKMVPSFRIIAFYHPTLTEVVSDSVWVDVDVSCMGSLKLELKNPVPSYAPRRAFRLRVTGDPGATVGLVAVDKAVYDLNNKRLLTQDAVWQTVEKADTGCTPGAGRNSVEVFFDAGLVFQTDSAVGTPLRQDVECSHHSWGNPAGTSRDAKPSGSSSAYSDNPKNTSLSYTCAVRKLYGSDGAATEDAFLHCCDELAKQRSQLKQNNFSLAHGPEDDRSLDSWRIHTRSRFSKSFLWVSLEIPRCSGRPGCDVNTHDMTRFLPDSVTTWVFTGISLSKNKGICVGETLHVVAFKDFFIDLRLPYSAVVGEQTEIRVILHNYIAHMDDPITVRVELKENADVCSSASKRGRYTQQVRVGPSSTHAVPFVIVPMKEGEFYVEVAAAVGDSWQSDKVTKPLRVVPQRVLTVAYKVVGLASKARIQRQTIDGIPEAIAVRKIPQSIKDPGHAFPRDDDYFSRTSKPFAVNGKAAVTMTPYYAVSKKNSDCTKFNLSLDFSLAKADEKDGDIYKLRVEFFSKSKTEDASMSVLEIAPPAGFAHACEDLDALTESRAVSSWEFNKAQYRKGSIVVYLGTVARGRTEKLAFGLRQTRDVGVLQPASVSMYEYGAETKCVKYYHPQRKDGQVYRHCQGDMCLCGENNCGVQKKGRVGSRERIAKMCEESQVDFAYKVLLEDVAYGSSLDAYVARVETVIKDGSRDKNAEGQLREFRGFSHCRESLKLEKQKAYLVMGAAEDAFPEAARSFTYLLGKNTWIEYWPRGGECLTEEYRPTCLGLEDLIETYETDGCDVH